MTTTPININRFNDVIDEYMRLGLSSIFIRNLNKFGRGNNDKFNFSIEIFIREYLKALKYIFEINKNRKFFKEMYFSILLTKILTPYGIGYIDLQSPAGAGIGGVIYNFDGQVFASDEGRMLSYEGDNYFRLGNVNSNSYLEIFKSDVLKSLVRNTIIEAIPGCAWCVYQPFCGADPVNNYRNSKDIIGFRPNSEFCKKNNALIEYIFMTLKKQKNDEINIYYSWINNIDLKEVKI
jgi:uncharacterized protein